MSDLIDRLRRLSLGPRAATPAPTRLDSAGRAPLPPRASTPGPLSLKQKVYRGPSEDLKWQVVRPVLLAEGYELGDAYFWSNWPRENLWHKSANVILVNERYGEGQSRPVYIKMVSRRSTELQIVKYLTTPECRALAETACFPVLKIFEPRVHPTVSFIIMPRLIPVEVRDMYTVADVVNFLRQVFEGVHFLHRSGISHGDLQLRNLMIVPADLAYPKPDVQYCIIDFGFSSIFQQGQKRLTRNASGPRRAAPEIERLRKEPGGPGFDPFAADTCQLGLLMKFEFLYHKKGLDFLLPLADAMTKEDPAERPDVEQVVTEFRSLCDKLEPEQFEVSLRSWKPERRPAGVASGDTQAVVAE